MEMVALWSPVNSVLTSNTYNALLTDLQQLWTEIGESQADKDRMLLELEREYLEVYRRKVKETANVKACLHHSVAAKEAELATLVAALGELHLQSPIPTSKRSSPLKEKLASVVPLVEDLRTKKAERIKQFADIKIQIEKIGREISGYNHNAPIVSSPTIEEDDLSLRKLNEYQTHLRALQKEKSDRLCKALEYVNEVHTLCRVLAIDFGETVSQVHPSLQNAEKCTNISDKTFEGLEQTIRKLKIERKTRIQKLKDIVASVSELLTLMDSPRQEQQNFSKIISTIRCSESEITEAGILSLEIIDEASAELERLSKLKASRMKELVMKKRSELEELCRTSHIEPDMSTSAEKSSAMINSGLVDPSELLANIEAQIVKAKGEAASRREVMERIDRWLAARAEENWLEEYNQDDSRYIAGRGAHVNLKRAERARVTVSKISGIVDNLINKTLSWEKEKNKSFLYDGVKLVTLLGDYKLSRKRKEEEKKRYRDQKKIQDLLLAEKESIYGSKPSPRKCSSFRKASVNGNGSVPQTPRRNSVGLLTPKSSSGRHNDYFKETRRLSTAPLNFVAISKEDTISTRTSVCGSEIDLEASIRV